MTFEFVFWAVPLGAIFAIGTKAGEGGERRRCTRLINEAFRYRASGSLRWVAEAVHEGREHLLPENEFFEERDPVPTNVVDRRERCAHVNRVPSSAGEFCADCGAEL